MLSDNLLGDNLNPIFSTAELHNLPGLEQLDLSGNSIRGIEEGLLIGCEVLKVSITRLYSCYCSKNQSFMVYYIFAVLKCGMKIL